MTTNVAFQRLISVIGLTLCLVIYSLAGGAVLHCMVSPLHGAVAASYDAGTAGNPAEAPDPTTPAGGGWTLNNTTAGDANFSWGGVSPDGTNGFNAWRIRDNSTTSSRFLNYSYGLTPQQQTDAAANGWRLSGVFRLQDPVAGNAGSRAVYLLFGNNINTRFIAFFDILPSGALEVNFQGTGGATIVLTTNLVEAAGYNTHEFIYDPATARAAYRFNGVVMLTNWSGTTSAFNGVKWGTESSGGRGEAWFNKVTFEIFDPPPVPEVVKDPQSSTNAVGESVTFSAVFTNMVLGYQWYKDGAPISGANAASYRIPFVTVLDSAEYVCRATNHTGSADTAPAALTVLPDSNPPTVSSAAGSTFASRVRVRFSEPVDSSSALTTGNYFFKDSAFTVSAAAMADPFTVDLFVTPLPEPGSNYTLYVGGVLDHAGNAVAANTSAAFTVPSGLPLMNLLVAAFDGQSAAPSPLGGVDWLDRSGNENHASNTVATANRRPTLLPQGLNGFSTLRFVQTNSQTLGIAAASGVGLSGSNHTWFFVFKPTLTGLPNRILAHQTSISASTWGTSIETGPMFNANGRTPTATSVGVTVGGVASNTWMMGEGWHDGSAGNVYIRLENMSSGVSTRGTNLAGTATGMAAPMTTWIGSANNAFFYDGEIAELLIYSNALSMAECAQVEDYLRSKYFPPKVSLRRNGSNLFLDFSGTLLSGDNVTGITNVMAGALSPLVLSNAAPVQFYRARRP